MSTFKENDFIVNADPYDSTYLFTGRVCRPDNGTTVQVELIDGTIHYWNVDECKLSVNQATNQFAKGTSSNPFVKGDMVEVVAPGSRHKGKLGVVLDTRYPHGPQMQIHFADGTRGCVWQGECVLHNKQQSAVSKAFAMMHPATPPVPAPPLKRSDRVRYIGTENIKFKNGVVDMVYIDINLNGSQTVADVFDDPFMYTAISIAELEVIPAVTGSHYQPVVDPTGDEPVKKPFDHDQLGTDLSGDDLMKSIRDFCEGANKW